MAGQVLDVLHGDALVEEVGDDHGPEAVDPDEGRKAGGPETALEHGAQGPGFDAGGARFTLALPAAGSAGGKLP